jgi:UDP-glucose 4-epimerase
MLPKRVIMASTNLVYAADVSRPAREDDPTTGQMDYPATKIVAERRLRESGLTWSLLRLAFVYGNGHLQSAPGLLGSWNWHPAATMSLIHHRDIATAMQLALAGAMDGRVVNLTMLPHRSTKSPESSARNTRNPPNRGSVKRSV